MQLKTQIIYIILFCKRFAHVLQLEIVLFEWIVN